MARKRDFRAEYQARQARARERGFGSYYQRRIRGGAGPQAPAPTGSTLALRRGHASAADLGRLLESGRVEILSQTNRRRDPRTGRITEVDIDVVTSDGETRTFRLRGKQLEDDELERLRDAVRAGAPDVLMYPSPTSMRLFDDGDPDLEEVAV